MDDYEIMMAVNAAQTAFNDALVIAAKACMIPRIRVHESMIDARDTTGGVTGYCERVTVDMTRPFVATREV